LSLEPWTGSSPMEKVEEEQNQLLLALTISEQANAAYHDSFGQNDKAASINKVSAAVEELRTFVSKRVLADNLGENCARARRVSLTIRQLYALSIICLANLDNVVPNRRPQGPVGPVVWELSEEMKRQLSISELAYHSLFFGKSRGVNYPGSPPAVLPTSEICSWYPSLLLSGLWCYGCPLQSGVMIVHFSLQSSHLNICYTPKTYFTTCSHGELDSALESPCRVDERTTFK